MKKKLIFCLLAFILFTTKNTIAWNFSSVDYAFTTDILEIIDEDYGIEFSSVLSYKSVWSARIGYYKHLEDSDSVYTGGKRRWELGFRWRYFMMEEAPNLIFLGIGFDNRPQDNSITPTGELGVNLCLKPLIISVVGFGGYRFHWNSNKADKWVKGIELRAGICF